MATRQRGSACGREAEESEGTILLREHSHIEQCTRVASVSAGTTLVGYGHVTCWWRRSRDATSREHGGSHQNEQGWMEWQSGQEIAHGGW